MAKIKKISFWIGYYESNQFNITIAKRKLRIDEIVIKQRQGEPFEATFKLVGSSTMVQEECNEVIKSIIGQDFSMHYQTYDTNTKKTTYDAKEDTIPFEGYIRIAECTRNEETIIDVTVYSLDHRLASCAGISCKSYEDATLEEIVHDVLDGFGNGLKTVINPAFKDRIPYCVRYNESKWDFLYRLARRYGEYMYNESGVFHFGVLSKRNQDVIDLVYPGKDVSEYQTNTIIGYQRNYLVASSYNNNDNTVKAESGEQAPTGSELLEYINKQSKEISDPFEYEHLTVGGFYDTDSKDTLLSHELQVREKAVKAFVVRYLVDTSNHLVGVGSRIRVVEKRTIKGKKYEHQSPVIAIDNCETTIKSDGTISIVAGGSEDAVAFPFITLIDANFRLIPKCTPCRAKVRDNRDPLGMGRVRVQFAWQEAQDPTMMTPWIRIAQPYAGGGKGFTFIPEIGEEVMVEFECDNGERPYVSGMLYNGKEAPEGEMVANNNDANQKKTIRTRNGHTIEFQDTPDGDGHIRIYDHGKEGYLIKLDSKHQTIDIVAKGDIWMESDKDITIRSGHDITIHADNELNLTASKELYCYAGEDFKTEVKRDRITNVKHNDELTVEQNQTVEVKNNQETKVSNKLQQKAASVRIEADQDLKEASTNHSIDAKSSYGVSSNGTVDIKGNMTKIN